MSWNLHGKSLGSLHELMQGMCQAPDVLLLQELGGHLGLSPGTVVTDQWQLNKVEYIVYVLNTEASFRCVACAIRQELVRAAPVTIPHPFGLLVKIADRTHQRLFGTLHFPHEQREDSLDTWARGAHSLHESLLSLSRLTIWLF